MVNKISFYKYQGTGNDFILIDNRNEKIKDLPQKVIAQWCDRKFGIGADGLMLLQPKIGYDFEMVYYNADGNTSSMCGNGGRCITAFANKLGILKDNKAYFWAIDGPHDALVTAPDYVELKMIDVIAIQKEKNHTVLDTGSPHYIQFVDKIIGLDVYKEGKKIRCSPPFNKEGINVNFVEIKAPQQISVATYERGVEDETLSCGTGVTAAAIAYHLNYSTQNNTIDIQTKGGELTVKFNPKNATYTDIWLCGKATIVFEGSIEL